MYMHTLRVSSPPCLLRQGPSLNLHCTIPARLAGSLAPMILSALHSGAGVTGVHFHAQLLHE